MKTSIKIAREHENVIMPSKRLEDAGYDLYADPKWLAKQPDGLVMIAPNQTVMIPTGIRTVIKSGYYAQIQERGSTGVKGMKYGAGVIDSGFRSTWNVVLTNCNTKPIVITTEANYDKVVAEAAERLKEVDPENAEFIDEEFVKAQAIFYPSTKGIAQFMILPVPVVRVDEITVEELLEFESERGEGKLGSSGK